MLNFCTLFDSNYLAFGMTMYNSLKKHCPDFHLYIFAFDDKCFDVLTQMDLPNITPISLKDFEDEELLAVKPTRSRAEYCWTTTPSTVLYILEKYGVDHCTYLDADLYFFSNPAALVEEMGSKSVLITEHRYSPKYASAVVNGIYCVQFMTFKNTQEGLKVLKWWRNACLEWCYDRLEEGRFGDQKYLDDWTTRFPEAIHVLEHLGGGVAPWNVQQYDFSEQNNALKGAETTSGKSFSVVFYHFHGIRFLEKQKIDLCEYELPETAKKLIYRTYLKAYSESIQELSSVDNTLNLTPVRKQKFGLIQKLKKGKRVIQRKLNNDYQVFPLKYFTED